MFLVVIAHLRQMLWRKETQRQIKEQKEIRRIGIGHKWLTSLKGITNLLHTISQDLTTNISQVILLYRFNKQGVSLD